VQTIDVLEPEQPVAATPSIEMLVVRPVPVIVTDWLPARGPAPGEIDAMVGAGPESTGPESEASLASLAEASLASLASEASEPESAASFPESLASMPA
jgi:hypothetical protein